MTDTDWLTRRPIAHRGFHDMNGAIWENTLPAFARAIEHGYAIECDVHLTLDGEVVVFHDNDLQRLAGQDGFVWQRTLPEMAALRIGTSEAHAPSLAEMLELVAGRVPLVIEIKGIAGHDEGLVAKVGEALDRYEGEAAVMSFDHWIVRDLARLIPERPAGLTAWGATQRDFEAHFSMLAHGVSFVSYDVAALPNPFVSFVRDKLGLPVITWTVREPNAVERTFRHADQMTFEGFEPGGVA
jgi:glycerophosphoryl diester phosphodiesterase